MINLISFIIHTVVSLTLCLMLVSVMVLIGELLVKIIPKPPARPKPEIDRQYHVNVGKCRRYLKKRGIKYA